MNKNSLVLLCLLVLLGYSQAASSFEGLWTNDVSEGGYGGNFSICVTGSAANGLYSEFGLAIGTISSNGTVFSGTFYQGGANCTTGPFTFTLIDNGTRFEGTYGCRNLQVYTWNGRRINNQTQSNYTCGQVVSFTSYKNVLDGNWYRTTSSGSSALDFCTDNNGGYQASYTVPSFTPLGYDSGSWYHSRKIATGVFFKANNNGALPGHSLWFINVDGKLVNLWWASLSSELNIKHINDTEIHSYDIYNFGRGTTLNSCSRFSGLANQAFDYYPYAHELFGFTPYVRVYPDFYPVIVNTTTNSTKTTNSTGSSDSSALAYSFVLLVVSLFFM